MNKKIAITLLVIIIIVLGAYFLLSKTGTAPEVSDTNGEPASYKWNFVESEPDTLGVSHTTVALETSGRSYTIGTFDGSCKEVKTGELGVLSEPSDPGEVSRVQCWFAGGGNEIGVFMEGGKTLVKVGELGEGSEEDPAFRGNFQTVVEL
ncbi:MAG: hypothetical protein Q7S15_02190 [bacterium]|nr:hypothetical protein [bacterium]